MKPMARRVHRLQQRVESQRNAAGETPADVLAREILRFAEAEGVPFELPPPGRLTDDRGRPLSVAEIADLEKFIESIPIERV